MKNIYTFIVFLIFHQTVYSQVWTPYWLSTDEGNYYDAAGLTRNGEKVTLNVLQDYEGAMQFKSGETYLSSTTTEEYDCERKTFKILEMYWWSGPQGTGDIVASSIIRNDTESHVGVKSRAAKILSIICKE